MTDTTEKATPIKIFTTAAMCVSTLHNVHRSHLQTWCSHNKSPDWCVHNRDTPPHAQSTPHQQKVRAREALDEEAKVTLVTYPASHLCYWSKLLPTHCIKINYMY